MSSVSKLARNGSHTSLASSSSSAVDTTSHDHLLNSIRSSPPSLRTWLHESWAPIDHRHERIAAGVVSAGIGALTQDIMAIHNQQAAPEVRGMLDCLPATTKTEELGFRQTLRTWTLRQKAGTWPLTRTEALLAKQYPLRTTRGN